MIPPDSDDESAAFEAKRIVTSNREWSEKTVVRSGLGAEFRPVLVGTVSNNPCKHTEKQRAGRR